MPRPAGPIPKSYALSKSLSGDSIYTIAATISLGQVQEADNQLSLATRTYRRVLQLGR